MASDLNVIGEKDLDDDMSQYSGLVIGHHTVGGGTIMGVKTTNCNKQQSVEGFTDRIEVRPDEAHIVAQANQFVDEQLAEGKLATGEEGGHYLNRTYFVDVEIRRRIREHRSEREMSGRRHVELEQVDPRQRTEPAKSAAMPSKQAAMPTEPPGDGLDAEGFLASIVAESRKPAYAETEADEKAGSRDLGDPFSSLGISLLGLEPTKPRYGLLRSAQGEIKFRWTWGVEAGDEEMYVLVLDNRSRIKGRSFLRRLRSLEAGSGELLLAAVARDVATAQSLNVNTMVQVFEFGCFTFMQFIRQN